MKTAIALRMYKGRQQIYDGTQCIDMDEQTEIQDWFINLCETTIGDDIDDVIMVKHSDMVTIDLDRDLYNMQMVTVYTLENGIKYVMVGYGKFYDEDEGE